MRTCCFRYGDLQPVQDESLSDEGVGKLLKERGMTISVAESCTGGLISDILTNIPGSSQYFDSAVICYSNASKEDLLGVGGSTILEHGPVSSEVTEAMAEAVRLKRDTTIGLAVTGVAGPDTQGAVPAGTVYVALSSWKGVRVRQYRFSGSRQEIKTLAAKAALRFLKEHIEQWI